MTTIIRPWSYSSPRPWDSRPHPLLAALSIGAAAAGVIIPLTPLGTAFGFTALPPHFYAFLAATVLGYLALVEVVKRAVYRRIRQEGLPQ